MIETAGTQFILWIFWIALSVLISIFFHELGHYVYWKTSINRNVKFGLRVIGSPTKPLSEKQRFEFYLSGILSGLIPIMFLIFIDIGFLLSLILYLSGCGSDFRKIVRIMRSR